jgi:hypothetical protein
MDPRSALTASVGVLGGSVVATAIAVGVGSALMVQASWVPLLATTPAVVVGFASTVSTVAGRGHDVTVTTISHPGLVAACACVVGATFGLAAEYLATALTRATSTHTFMESAEGNPA